VLVLTYAIVRTNAYGLKLAGAVFLLFFGINVCNTQIEAVFFQLQIPRTESINMFFQGLLVTLIFSYILVLLLDRMHRPASNVESKARSSISIIGYVWRFIVCDISYVILYCFAGAIILPYVQDFYSSLAQTPAVDKVLIMQVFRGLIYVIVILPIIRMFNKRRLEAAVMVGLQLSILGGIAPLLPPNPYMPAEIRLVHGIEIGISNFIYGVIIGLLFASKLKE
jgi:threonine/homoserine/homoserine lactone efflux protein